MKNLYLTEMKEEEALIFYKLITEGFEMEGEKIPPKSPEEAIKSIELTDQMLIILKTKSLLSRKIGVRKLLTKLLVNHISNNAIPGTNNNHLL